MTMAEYIDRNAFLEHMKKTNRYFDVKHDIENFPAADVAPVVRCKDCKHSWEDISGLCCSNRVCIDLNVPCDFYCAYGERKEHDE